MQSSAAADYVARRRRRRQELIARARRFVEDCHPRVALRAAVVFGSVGRGDWTDESDIDVLLVADDLPDTARQRLNALALPEDRVHPIVWSTADWKRERRRGNPIATDALAHGVWLVGSPDALNGEDAPS